MGSPVLSHKVLTLCIPRRGGRVLLGMKKRGFGSGRWNGFGGKVEPGEMIDDAAVRECFEEACIEVTSMEKVGHLRFTFVGDPVAFDVHVYRVDAWTGEPAETDEMAPEWFTEGSIPFDTMWPDDQHWFPRFLAGEKFLGEFAYDGPDTIVSSRLMEVVAV